MSSRTFSRTNGHAVSNGVNGRVLPHTAPKGANRGRDAKLAAGKVSFPFQKLFGTREEPPLISLDFSDTELVRYLVLVGNNPEPQPARSRQLWLHFHDNNTWSSINRGFLTQSLADLASVFEADVEIETDPEIDLSTSVLWDMRHINALPSVIESWCAANGLVMLSDQQTEDMVLWLTRPPGANAATPAAQQAVRQACRDLLDAAEMTG